VDVRVYYHVVLTSTLDGSEWLDLPIDRSTLKEIFLLYDCNSGCVGPKAGLDVLEKRHFASAGNRTQDCQACSFVTVLTTKSDPNLAVKASGQIPSTIKQFGSQNQFRQSPFVIAHCVFLLVLSSLPQP
jgi:hypothetical protein